MKKIIIIVATIAFCALLSSCASLQKQTSAIGSNFDTKYSGEEISLSFGWSKNKEPEVVGYIIGYGTASKEYDRFIVVNSGELEDPENPHKRIHINTAPGVEVYYFGISAFSSSFPYYFLNPRPYLDVSEFSEDEIVYHHQ